MKPSIKEDEIRNTNWIWLLLIFMFLLFALKSRGATYTSNVATGNWSSSGTWSPLGVPGSGDNVIIHGGHVITVDTNFTCNNLTIGDATSGVTTVQITAANHSLAINGALSINPNSINNTYTLNAGPGSINISGTFPTWSTTGTNNIEVGAGILTINPAISISSANQNVIFTAAGTINFNSSFTDSYNSLTTYAGCMVNFAGSYTVNTTPASWAGKGTAYFSGTGNITANANLTLFNVQLNSSAATTVNSGGGNLIIGGSLTASSSSTFTTNSNFEVDGAWVNNGAAFNWNGATITLNGAAQTIGGTTATAFPALQIGLNTAITVAITMNNNNSCSSLTFYGYTNARTFTITTGDTLTISGDLTINQPTGAVINSLSVNAGTCIVNGNLNFNGTNNTTTYISKVAVTTGTFSLSGNVNWMANTAVTTEVITVSTGTLTFGSSVTMGTGSGTLSVTSTGTINFNGTSSPSFNFGGAATSPVFTTTAACKLNFNNGFTNNTNSLVIAATSTVTLGGSGTITPNASLTLPNLIINANDTLASGAGTVIVSGTLTLSSGSAMVTNQNIEVDGNWTNNGGTLNSTAGTTITLNGAASSIGGTTPTTFPILQIGQAATVTTEAMVMNTSNTCTGLVFSSATKARTLTLSTGTTLSINGNLTINQPGSSVKNTLAVNTASCTVTGGLTFTGTTNISTWVAKVVVTTGSFAVNGAVTWMNDTVVATQVITVSTGSITFGSSLSMGKGNGTLSVTSTGTINFNGPTAPSFNFGGAATAPVFTTTNGCKLNFANGFTNNTTALVLAATSVATFTGYGAITPNANITFGNMQINAGDTVNSATGSAIVAGVFTISAKSALVISQNFEVRGNWVNNGGTVSSGANSIILNGTAQSIGGTSSTTFQTLQVGGSSVASTVVCTMNINTTCSSVVFHSSTTARTLTLTTGYTLTITGDLDMNQPAGAKTNALNVNGGACTVGGNLVFTGTTNTTSWVAKVAVTTGSFTLAGNVTWMANTAVATEVISVTAGTLTFANSLTMGTGSGTLSVAGAATVNFNGTTASSFAFGGAATSPSFTTVSGSTIKFKNGFTNNTNAFTFTNGSTEVFTGNGTITPGAAITFGNIQINAGDTLTLAGNIFITNNWTDNGGFVPGTNAVTMNGLTANTQTIAKPGGETFYKLSVTTSGATLLLASNVIITNLLTMSGHYINLNNDTLTLGNGAGASLAYTTGSVYGGIWKRWLPVTAITSNSSLYYGLIPIGTSSTYSPVAINSTVNPTTAGYVLASYSDATTITLVTYTDNEAAAIQVIANKKSTLTTSGLAGGTYSLTASFTGFTNSGVTTDLKLETYTGSTMGSAGTSSATTGTVVSPNVIRTGLSTTQLSNVWVIGSKNKTNTPLEQYYYSRKSGNWDDVTTGNSTWSYIAGGSGASCNCTPVSTGYAIISTGDTVTSDVTGSVDYLDINTGGRLVDNGVAALTINRDLNIYGTGTFVNSSVWTVTGNMNFSAGSSPSGSGTVTFSGTLSIPTGATYKQTSGTLNITGNASIIGTLSIGTATLNFNGGGTTLSGTGNITSTGSSTINMSNSRSILAGSNLIIGSSTAPVTFAITGTTTMTNYGHVKVYGNLTGNVAGSTWTNGANAYLEVTGGLLATGTLNASTSPDTVKYSGNGSQTIKAPASSYNELILADSGTKSLSANITVDNDLLIQDTVILSAGSYAINGNGNLDMTGSSQLTLQRSTSGTYPEINGNFNLNGGAVIMNQTSGTAIINNGNYNNLTLIGSGAYDMSGISYIAGNFTVQGSATLVNSIPLTVAGNFTYSSTGSTLMNDDISAAGFTLTSGTLNDGGNNINITGSGGWNNNGCTFTSSGFTLFNGSTAQQIAGSQATTFNSLQINNTAGVTLNVNPAAPTVVSGALLLTSGKLYTSATNILRILNNATSSGGSDSCYVEGPVVKVGNDNFIFPIGKSGYFRKAGISNILDSLTEVTAEYFHAQYDTVQPVTGKLYKVSGQEYWMVERAVTTDSLQLELFWENITQISGWQCNEITIAHFKNSQWVEEPATSVSGSNCAYGGSGSLLTTGYVTSFSPFTFGGEGAYALPIQLLSFTAASAGVTVQTNWTTAAEINNDYFTLERSPDAINFSDLARIKGAGNSSVQNNYEWTDEEPLPGISYYRLRQTDFNGNQTYSDIVAVNLKPSATIKLYPNPAHNEVFLNISNPENEMQCTIYDLNGRVILARKLETENGASSLNLPLHLGNIPAGMYLVTISGATGMVYREKLIVK